MDVKKAVADLLEKQEKGCTRKHVYENLTGYETEFEDHELDILNLHDSVIDNIYNINNNIYNILNNTDNDLDQYDYIEDYENELTSTEDFNDGEEDE